MCVYAGAVLVMIFAANVGAVHQPQRGRLRVSGSSPGTEFTSEPVAAAVLGAEAGTTTRTTTVTSTTSTTSTASSSVPQDTPRVLIVYSSRSVATKSLAEYIAGGVQQFEAPDGMALEADVMNVTEVPHAQLPTSQSANVADANATALVDFLQSYAAIMLGSGVYNGLMDADLSEWTEEWPVNSLDLSWTVTNAFCTSGGPTSGAQPMLYDLQRVLQTFNGVFAGGTSWRSGTGVCAVNRETNSTDAVCEISAEDAKLATYLGARTAMLASALWPQKKAYRQANSDPFDYSNENRSRIVVKPTPPSDC